MDFASAQLTVRRGWNLVGSSRRTRCCSICASRSLKYRNPRRETGLADDFGKRMTNKTPTRIVNRPSIFKLSQNMPLCKLRAWGV